MITAAEVLTAILTLFPHMSGNNRQCIIEHRPQIEQVLVQAQQEFPEMPTELMASIGLMETHLGCDRGEGGNWGAPISSTQRHVAGTPMHAVRALWRSYQVCHTWDGAARRFRTGLCRPTQVGTRYSTMAMNLSNRIKAYVTNRRINSQMVCVNTSRVCRSM